MLRVVILQFMLWYAVKSAEPNCTADVAEALGVYSRYLYCNVTNRNDGFQLVIHNNHSWRTEMRMIPNVEKVTHFIIHDILNKIDDDAFGNFNDLKLLELTGNSIKQVPTGVFANLLNVTHLDLARNEIESMSLARLPPNLLQLNLNDNKLRRTTGLSSHPNLQRCNLANNLLTTFVMELDFPSLVKLTLTGNRIKEYYTPTLSDLHELNLNNNALTQIPADMLRGLVGLFDLDLSNNFIETIDAGAFTHSPSLTVLNMANNSLKVLNADVFPRSGSKVTSLRLKHNRLQFLSLRLLAKMPDLSDISLHKNPWICGCLDDLLNWIEEFKIHIWCRAHSFNGTVPVCVVHSGEKNICPYRYFEQDATYFMQRRSKVISVDNNCPNIL